MDRFPSVEAPELADPNQDAEQAEPRRRKRRPVPGGLLESWQQRQHGEEGTKAPREEVLWDRTRTAEDPPGGEVIITRNDTLPDGHAAQEFGGSVLDLSDGVEDFARTKAETLAPDSPKETGKLVSAADELQEESSELKRDLGDLGKALASATAEAVSGAATLTSEALLPKSNKTETAAGQGMAQLVVTALFGGLGTLFAGGERQRRQERKKHQTQQQATDQAKTAAEQKIEQQATELAAQAAELERLKNLRLQEVGLQDKKEYIRQTTELTERQADLTHSAADQVKQAVQDVERTYRIPEQPGAGTESAQVLGPEVIPAAAAEQIERLKDTSGERLAQDTASQTQPVKTTAPSTAIPQQQQINQPATTTNAPWQHAVHQRRHAARTWAYAALIAAAAIITLGLLIF